MNPARMCWVIYFIGGGEIRTEGMRSRLPKADEHPSGGRANEVAVSAKRDMRPVRVTERTASL
jgi:hypothetical protein